MERIEIIKEKLLELKDLDKAFSVFGSDRHQYNLNKTLSESEIIHIENTNKIVLSKEYTEILTRLGNGVPGPGYGLEKLSLQNINPPYIGTDKLLRNCKNPNKIDLDMVNLDEISGCIKLFDYGCGMEQCLIVNGPETGELIFFDCDGRFEKIENKGILDIYEEWLDKSLVTLKRIQQKIQEMPLQEVIDSERKMNNYLIIGMILSVIGASQMKDGFYGIGQESHLEKQYKKWKKRQQKERNEWWKFWKH